MRCLFFIVLTFCYSGLFAQNITVVEYFFDTDPGYGSGNSVAITPATSITNFTFPVNIAAQSDGFHTLFVRAKDANNNWSAAYSKLFYKLNIPAVTPASNITKIEYFLDTDPGFGSGTDVPITPGVTITNHNFAIPLTSVTDGFHTLFVRTRNANSQWSATYSQPFYKFSAAALAPAPNINKIEYFLDTDPGYGAGTNVPITPSVSIADHNFTIPLSSTADGFHTLYVRSRDANNNWGAAYSRPFYKLSSSALPPVPNVNKLEYFIDADPGYGLGINVAITPGVSIPDLSVPIPVTAITEGNHIITFRARDVNNNWSVVAIKSFSKCNHPGTTINAAASITSSGFTASWADVPGSIGYRLDVSTDNFSTFVTGYNNKVINAPALSSAVTGLSQATTYQYRVRAVASCASVESNTVNLITLATPPSAQPTNLLFSSITSTSYTGFFTAPAPAPTGYLVVRKIGSASVFVPANNATYTLNQNVGDGVVAYVGPNFLFNEAGLTPDTQYFYKVFAYNQVSTSISYLTASPLQNNVKTVALEPTAQPTNLQFSAVTDVGFSVNFTADTGSPTGYLVLRKTGSAPTEVPVDGTTYTTTIGTDAVVHNAAATNFSQTGLTQNTEYFYTVYAYNGSGTSLNYRAVAPLQGSQLTLISPPAAAPTGLLFSNVTTSSITVAYTAASGSPAGYLVIRKPGSSPTFNPQPNTVYTAGQVLTDGTVAYVGSALTFIDNLLLTNTTYHYDVFAYNQSGALINYQTLAPLEGSRSTLAAEPIAQPTAISFSSLSTSGFTVSYTAASGAPSGYLAVRSVVATPAFVPVDGTTYSVGIQGSDFISFIGAGNSFPETGLTSNTRYYYAIYSYNGGGTTINYRNALPLTGDQLTLLVPPSVQPTNITFSAVTSGAMTVGFTAAAGVTGYVVVRGTGVSPTFVPQNNVSYTNGPQTGGEIVSVGTATSNIINTSLTASTEYFYKVYAYNQSGLQISYNLASPLAGSKFTFTAEPTAQASGLIFANPTINSLTVNFTAASPAPAGYLVLRKSGTAATGIPNDGQAYSLLDPIGDGVTAYVGSTPSFVDTGLQAGTTYFYQVFSYNGAGVLTNYLTTVNASNSGSKITVPGKPATPTANEIGQTQFRINWTATTGADSYRLDVSKDNFVSRVAGFDNLTVSGLTQLVNGLENGTAYKYRIRAGNESGTSVNSDEAQQFTIPATPVLSAATNIGQTSFTANWTAVTSATEYFIDVSLNNNFIPLVVGYENKSVGNNITAELAGLTSGTTHYYRIRSKNDGGVSPNSTTKDQLLIPATPLALDGSNAIQNSFKANWQPVVGADRYEIDIALTANNFNPILLTENNILGNQTEYLAINLTANTAYSYRIRAANGAGISPSSVPRSISTTPPNSGIPLQLSSPVYTAAFTTASTASIEVSGGTAPYVMQFFHRKITSSDDHTSRTLTATGTTFTYQPAIDASILDELGVEFYFKVTDANGASRESAKQYIYKAVPSEGIKIPFTRFGGTGESYELFSIPYQVTNNRIDEIFKELGIYKKSQWRLLRYQGGRNVDFGEGITTIELGKGYWFNRKENVEISFSGGIVVNANQTTDAVIRLEAGWNQIGNPFPFDVDWSEVLAKNSGIGLISNLRVFNPTGFHLNDESDTLKTWGGGFVHNANSTAVDLRLPVSLKNSAGGRKSSRKLTNTKIDQSEWLVPITIRHGEVVSTSGIGMHPQASELIDPYDDFVVPRFLNYLELYAYHDEFFTPKFSMDVVPTTDTYHWALVFATNGTEDPVTIQWDQEALGVNDAQLILYDVSQRTLVNMKTTSHYTFQPAPNQQFRIFYGSNQESLRPDITVLGNAYPNPFTESMPAKIPFMVMQPESKVVVNIFDMMGRPVKLLVDGTYGYGVHETKWRGETSTGDAAAPGMYLIQMEVDGRKMTGRIIKR